MNNSKTILITNDEIIRDCFKIMSLQVLRGVDQKLRNTDLQDNFTSDV